MDMNRGVRGPAPAQHSQAPAQTTTQYSSGHANKKKTSKGGIIKYIAIALLFSATILGILVIAAIALRSPQTSAEDKHIDKSKFQAVFLNGGQVYFGKVQELNGKFIRIKDIYYLQVSQQVQPNTNTSTNKDSNDVSLVKLGCELHGPQDEMLINREQVMFWENLKADGQVTKAVEEYRKANPNGQTCNASNSSATQGSTNTTTPATGN